MKLTLIVTKTNASEIEAYLACLALEAITENIEINSHFACPTVYGYIRDIPLCNLFDIETAMINLRAYKSSIVRCKVYHDTLLTVIKAESTRKRAELFKDKIADTYSSDTMNLTELKFYLDYFVLED